jgi:hypothetical protein
MRSVGFHAGASPTNNAHGSIDIAVTRQGDFGAAQRRLKLLDVVVRALDLSLRYLLVPGHVTPPLR